MVQDDAHPLRALMQQVGFSSYRALSQSAGVSEKQLRQLRRGAIAHLRLHALLKVSQTLQVSLPQLLATLEANSDTLPYPPYLSHSHTPSSELTVLRQEYDRLQNQLAEQKQELLQEFQQSSLQILEPLLLQLPTAAFAAQQNPQAPAVKLLPLLKPIDHLLQEWGIEAIAPVGTELPYDPHYHQLMEGTAEIGEPVRVRYTGYRWGDRLLYRAKVSRVRN
jgi:molecular chaperone GrpE (heat shock protein)